MWEFSISCEVAEKYFGWLVVNLQIDTNAAKIRLHHLLQLLDIFYPGNRTQFDF